MYPNADLTLYRAILMNKHAGGGSDLPWHQDGGDFWGLDRDPVLQIWTAMDDAPSTGKAWWCRRRKRAPRTFVRVFAASERAC